MSSCPSSPLFYRLFLRCRLLQTSHFRSTSSIQSCVSADRYQSRRPCSPFNRPSCPLAAPASLTDPSSHSLRGTRSQRRACPNYGVCRTVPLQLSRSPSAPLAKRRRRRWPSRGPSYTRVPSRSYAPECLSAMRAWAMRLRETARTFTPSTMSFVHLRCQQVRCQVEFLKPSPQRAPTGSDSVVRLSRLKEVTASYSPRNSSPTWFGTRS